MSCTPCETVSPAAACTREPATSSSLEGRVYRAAGVAGYEAFHCGLLR